jgi:hypothetical protein
VKKALTGLLSLSLIFSVVTPVAAGDADPAEDPGDVTTASEAALDKVDDDLRDEAESGSTEILNVFVTTVGEPAEAETYLDDSYVADGGEVSLMVGQIRANELAKIAALDGVVHVGPIDLRQTGQPLGVPDPDLNQRPDVAALQARMNELRHRDVPYHRAPAPRGSNFDELQELAVLDARTHGFAEAWDRGFTGTDVTVGVLDGGTDWGHPDLLGTWQVWPAGITETSTRDSGWAGWPMAFDPYDTLVWLLAPEFVDQGLSWYTWTEAHSDLSQTRKDQRNHVYRVTFATRTGPSRNFDAPDGFNSHEYTFPTSWTKSGTVKLGSHPDDHLLMLYEERPAFIVVDPNSAGVYDTVYVDLDNDHDFSDEKPITKSSPAAYRDMNGDGYVDISGGLLYYISDPATRIPGGLTSLMEDPTTPEQDTPAPPSGDLLAWTGDYDPAIEGHGTLTASNIVGQGVINGLAPCFKDLKNAPGAEKCQGGGTYPGAVIGGAPDARLAPFGDIYFSFDFSTQFGYYLSNLRGVNVTSNSYGNSDVDNDGYDAASQEADVIHAFVSGARTTPLFSTGNGAPGFGTTSPPSPSLGISVGASTQFGGTGWDSIRNYSQIVDDDVMVWSNRGPGATGTTGVDVVADGAFSAGDIPLNTVLSGNFAWETWGGTSRSTPVAVATTALIYDAWTDAHGATIPAGFSVTAKEILQSSAEDLGYGSWIQGAGSVDAGMAVRAATGGGVTQPAAVGPSEWRVGDYRGDEWDVFAHVIAPGGSDSQTFTINGTGSYDVSDRYMTRTDSETMSFTSSDVDNESVYNFNAPDYLINITDIVAAHPNADLMVVRLNSPRGTFDVDEDYASDNEFRLLTYNWTDQDHDHRLWRDRDHDGVVDHRDKNKSSNIDGNLDLNFERSEMDRGEYIRFMYHRAGANTLQSFVRDPNARMADGMFIGLQHFLRTDAVQQTSFDIQIDFYENSDWSWVSTPATASGSFTADVAVPADTPYGMYDGAIVLTDEDEEIVVPVLVTVAPTLTADADGNLPSVTFGGDAVATAQEDLLYNNGTMFGASDWTWRSESGDWRFFYFDVDADVAPGTLFLANTTWDDPAPFTDFDTLVFGPSVNPEGQVLCGDCLFGAPYILDTVGGSPNTDIGSGIWIFDTASGGAQDLISAPAQEGLHAVVLHQVGYDGGKFHVPFQTSVGTARLDPASVELLDAADTGSFSIDFTSGVDLSGIDADAFGLSQPIVLDRVTQQDDPNDPSTATVKEDVTISHASTARFTVDVGTDDVDLYIVFDADSSGTFTNDEIVAASTGPAGSDEFVELVNPEDGDYQVWAQGWQVSGTPTIQVGIDVIQGLDITISDVLVDGVSVGTVPTGAIPAGSVVTIEFDYANLFLRADPGETAFGEVLMGPLVAPTALRVPVTITRGP